MHFKLPSSLTHEGVIIFITSAVGVYLIYILVNHYLERREYRSYMTSVTRHDRTTDDYIRFDENSMGVRQSRYEKYLREAAEQQARADERKRKRLQREAEELSQCTDPNANLSVCFDPFESPEDFVKTKLEANKVLVFARRNCPFSARARAALNTFPIPETDCEVVELDDYSSRAALRVQKVLEDLTGQHSVPRVFIGGKCLGGGQDTEDALKNGRLEELLREAKVIE